MQANIYNDTVIWNMKAARACDIEFILNWDPERQHNICLAHLLNIFRVRSNVKWTYLPKLHFVLTYFLENGNNNMVIVVINRKKEKIMSILQRTYKKKFDATMWVFIVSIESNIASLMTNRQENLLFQRAKSEKSLDTFACNCVEC